MLSEETLAEKTASKNGEVIELSTMGNDSRKGGSSRTMSNRVGSVNESDQNSKRGMVLPFQPLAIAFNDIRYSIDMPQVRIEYLFTAIVKNGLIVKCYYQQEMKKEQGITTDRLELLKGITGAFRPGILTALMGVSGAGKTTLMDVLSGRKTGGYIEGTISIAGYPKKQETFARISGYCEQTDIHSPHVTVYESLVYSAWLRLPPEVDVNTRKVYDYDSHRKAREIALT